MSEKFSQGNFLKQQQTENPKVYACLDLDAFFAQCESRRLGLDDSVPLVALQWTSCWGVNYAARKYGLTSGMNIHEARKMCPDLVVAHADTIKLNDNSAYVSPYERDISEKFKTHDKNKEKVTLDLYRCESEKIFSIMRKHCNVVEKGSIDEAFLDITPNVQEIYKKGEYKREWKGKFMGGQEFEPETLEDIFIMIGTHVIEEIRVDIKETLNYTCSGGISFNKMLAKLGSGMNKPYGQAIITRKYAAESMRHLDIKKVRNFGRRIAEAFEEVGIKKISEVQDLGLEKISEIVGDEQCAKWVYFRARGYDDEIVEEKDYTYKSILSNRSFYEVTNMLDLEEIEDLIITDLCVRVKKFYEESKMVPHAINLHYYDNDAKQYRVKSTAVNMKVKKEMFLKIMKDTAHGMVKSVSHTLFPCRALGVSAKSFEKSDIHKYEFDLVSYAKKQKDQSENKSVDSFPNSKILGVDPSFDGSLSIDDLIKNRGMAIEDESVDLSELEECERCHQTLPKEMMKDHMDFHTAEDLDRELNPNKKKYKKMASQVMLPELEKTPKEKENQMANGQEYFSQIVKKVKKTPPEKQDPKSSQMIKIENFFRKKQQL